MNDSPDTPSRDADGGTDPEISVIVPIFNEAENIAALLARMEPVLGRVARSFEILFIDDGSTDATREHLRAAHDRDGRIAAISFSRNFGKEIAIAAGLDHARGRAVIIMDADLQHPPELIGQFVEKWREGYHNVFAQRLERQEETAVKRYFARRFYELFDMFGETHLPPGGGDFRLLDRKAVDALRTMGERARFSKGLYAWIGFKSIGVPFQVDQRLHGSSKFSYRKLTRFALDGLMSFSTAPLKIWTYIGTVISVTALVMAAYFLIEPLFYGVDVPGYASLIVSIMFFSGVQLMSLGILGEYIGRIFAEVKRRPLYIVDETIGEPHAQPVRLPRDERQKTP